MDSQTALVQIGLVERALAEAKSLEQLKDVRDKSQLLSTWFKKRDGYKESYLAVAELKVRAERRMGEMLADEGFGHHGGDRKSSSRQELEKLGFNKKDSHYCLRIASLSDDVFEEAMAYHKDELEEIYSSAFLKLAGRHARRQKRKARLDAAAGNPGRGKGEVITGDCVEKLAGIPDGAARLVFADPPYNVGIDYGEGEAADLLPDDEYMVWVASWLSECKRVLTDDGSLWVLISDEYAAEYGVTLKRIGFTIRNWLVWYESFGVNCANKFNRTKRHLFYCVKDAERFVFHPEAVGRPSARQVLYNDARAEEGGKLWDDVWAIPRLTGTSSERLDDFPTQLPLALLRPIVEVATDPGDLVIDPFNGSGTTGVAAVTSGRRYLGIERSATFAELADLRIKGA
jgi:site-specific DNA-methyltransferase (adenine-specific)